MSTHISRPTFDQTDKRYACLCGQLHIQKGARIVAVVTNLFTVINIIFSLTRNATVAVYTLMSAAFAVVVFGSLLYGVFKEKRIYLIPYLVFQVISIGVTILLLFIFIISIAVNSNIVIDLANDIGNVDVHLPQVELDTAIATFTVLFILVLCFGGLLQAYFLDVIYSFHTFLKERETSFNFNFESSTNHFTSNVLNSSRPELDIPMTATEDGHQH